MPLTGACNARQKKLGNEERALESNDCDVGGTRGVLGVRKLERTGFGVYAEALNTVSVLARYKQVLATRVEGEVPSIRVSR